MSDDIILRLSLYPYCTLVWLQINLVKEARVNIPQDPGTYYC